jgi:hypothetical protein
MPTLCWAKGKIRAWLITHRKKFGEYMLKKYLTETFTRVRPKYDEY